MIRSDNGTKFHNVVLNNLYTDKGISRQFSVPKIPQQNGVIERKNRTFIGTAKTMFGQSKLHVHF